MECKCGFRFEQVTDLDARSYRSFAVIDDGDYAALLRAERRVLAAKGDAARLRALGSSAKYVATMMECPECSRLVLVQTSPTDKVIFYRRESES